MKKFLKDWGLAVGATWIYAVVCLTSLYYTGCATIDPKADKFVVQVERSQTVAASSIDFVLNLDQENRPFWRTNAPAFHSFCSWLRTPVPYQGTNIQRALVMQLNVDDLKQIYKAQRNAGSSNNLYNAWQVLKGAISQSTSWSNIVTAPVQ